MGKKTNKAHEHMAKVLGNIMDQREDALTIANAASTFMISRCKMLNIHPFMAFIFLRHLAERNVENFIEQSFEETSRSTGKEMTPELHDELMGITKAMEKVILQGLSEAEISVEDI